MWNFMLIGYICKTANLKSGHPGICEDYWFRENTENVCEENVHPLLCDSISIDVLVLFQWQYICEYIFFFQIYCGILYILIKSCN